MSCLYVVVSCLTQPFYFHRLCFVNGAKLIQCFAELHDHLVSLRQKELCVTNDKGLTWFYGNNGFMVLYKHANLKPSSMRSRKPNIL